MIISSSWECVSKEFYLSKFFPIVKVKSGYFSKLASWSFLIFHRKSSVTYKGSCQDLCLGKGSSTFPIQNRLVNSTLWSISFKIPFVWKKEERFILLNNFFGVWLNATWCDIEIALHGSIYTIFILSFSVNSLLPVIFSCCC